MIISLAAVALLGALTTSITGSSEHSSLASIDTLLRSYADAAKEQIQLQPVRPLFDDSCSASYPMITFTSPPGYTLSISAVNFWNPTNEEFADANAPVECVRNNDNTTIQQITVLGRAPNNVSDTLSFVVTDPLYANPAPPATVSVSASPGQPTPGSMLVFTATVSPTGGMSTAPTGEVSWSFGPGTPATAACPTSQLTASGSSGMATCAVSSAKAGTYTLTATYLGDNNYQSATGSGSATVATATPTLQVTAPGTSAVGQALTFTATISGPSGDPTPTGTVTWGLTPTGTCKSVAQTGSANVLTATCTITPVASGTYSATVSIAADPAYKAAGPSSPPATVTVS